MPKVTRDDDGKFTIEIETRTRGSSVEFDFQRQRYLGKIIKIDEIKSDNKKRYRLTVAAERTYRNAAA